MHNYRNFKDYHIERLKNPEDAKIYFSVACDDYKETKDIGAFLLAVRDVAEARGRNFDDFLKEAGIFDEVSALCASEVVAVDNRSKFDAQIFENLEEAPSVFDDMILKALQCTINEASTSYKHGCYLATIVLCGKIIETLLAHAYECLTDEYPFGNRRPFAYMRRKLRDDYKVLLGPTVDEMLELIYVHRSVGVYRNTFPSEDDAHSIVVFTQNVINIIYQYFKDESNFK